MISKKYIKDMEFKTINDIFEYIVESKINGNYSQAKELINKLSKKQNDAFIGWFLNTNTIFSEDNINIKTFIEMRYI